MPRILSVICFAIALVRRQLSKGIFYLRGERSREQVTLDAQLAASLANLSGEPGGTFGQAVLRGLAWGQPGQHVADEIWAWRSTDGFIPAPPRFSAVWPRANGVALRPDFCPVPVAGTVAEASCAYFCPRWISVVMAARAGSIPCR